MNPNRIVTKSELMSILEESVKNEFKAKFGNGAKQDGRENEKATDQIRKDAEAYDKAGRKDAPKRKESENNDYNKGMFHLNFETEPGKDWIERTKSQCHGYPSKYNEEHNDMDKSLGYEGNKNFYKSEADRVKRDAKSNQTERESGLKANQKDSRGLDYSNKKGVDESEMHNNMNMMTKNYQKKSAMTTPDNKYPNTSFTRNDEIDDNLPDGNERRFESGPANESKPKKRLVFKNTRFLSEAQVLERVPDEYKIDENRFYMRDNTGTDYLIECQADQFGYVHTQIVNKINKQAINEELEKIKRLSGYNYSDDNKKVDKSSIEDMSESIRSFKQLLNK